MAYKKPTREQIEMGLEEGYTLEECERGYVVSETFGGLLEIERIDAMYPDFDDDDASVEASRSGYCKIIPINELPKGMPKRMYIFGWVDTEENRSKLQKWVGM